MKKIYRIVTDAYMGYEVQWRYKWVPIWFQANGTNTSKSLEEAECFARQYAKLGKVVKYLGEL